VIEPTICSFSGIPPQTRSHSHRDTAGRAARVVSARMPERPRLRVCRAITARKWPPRVAFAGLARWGARALFRATGKETGGMTPTIVTGSPLMVRVLEHARSPANRCCHIP
jgi:hypothetical protein